MKIKKQSKKNIILLPLGLVLLILIVGLGIYWYLQQTTATPSSDDLLNQTASSEQEKQAKDAADAQNKQDFLDSQPKNEADANSSNNDKAVSLTATQEVDGSVTIITKLISIASGTCNLTISRDGNQTTRTAQVIYQPDYSTCAGFSIPSSELGPGTWHVHLAVATSGTQYTAQGEINVR